MQCRKIHGLLLTITRGLLDGQPRRHAGPSTFRHPLLRPRHADRLVPNSGELGDLRPRLTIAYLTYWSERSAPVAKTSSVRRST